ncbi:hypothetical protein K431DRAFT_281957 [Polychaeton citri CBS 116435]|uniref:Uncharacterized protein n=1 Tax=Polychaeton citri CBS 116435 TaxID=1314669 RepID=A0A9P4US16_9PEZI|nr:hypothetical protein K431DRAFT_281957 [Polychaeton citri CBS 116435]
METTKYQQLAEHWKPAPEANPSGSTFLPLLELPSRPPKGKMSPFLRLPTEIRLQIYSLLLLPHTETDLLPSYQRVASSTQDYFDYEKRLYGTDRPATSDLSRPTLLIRTLDPLRYNERYSPPTSSTRPSLERQTYSVRCGRFNARTLKTTYHCVNNPPNLSAGVGILGANRQIHAEAAELLYSYYTFDFDTHVEAIQPFLSDLTPFSRSCIRSTRIVKRALAYEKDFDRCEWSNAFAYLNAADSGIFLRKLELAVVAGRPGRTGWDRIPKYKAADFNILIDMEGMEWVRDLLEIRGLQELEVSAVVEHCPPATTSGAMAGYVRFSASVECAFAQFLNQALLVRS